MNFMFNTGLRPNVLAISLIILVTIVMISSQILIRTSEKFNKAKLYIEESQDLRKLIGAVEGYGFFINANEKSNERSYMIFAVEGTQAKIKVRVFFKRDSDNVWVVEKCTTE